MAKQEVFLISGFLRLYLRGSWDGCACHFESRNFTKLYTLFKMKFKDNFRVKRAFFLYLDSQISNSHRYNILRAL